MEVEAVVSVGKLGLCFCFYSKRYAIVYESVHFLC